MSNKIQKLICFKNRKPWFLFIPKQDSHTNDCPSSVQIRESLDFDLRENCINMYKYERIIYWSNDDNAFIVEVPELPGCMADGKNVEEAIANAEIIIKEWIEVTIERGLEVPEPKGRLMYA